MRLRFASTALDGLTMTVTATQNGFTAGPLMHARWDLAEKVVPTPSGEISIQIGRSTAQVAPDSVRFSVQIGAGAFPGFSGPAEGAYYDARMHDLVYLWDFGATEDAEWTAPENVLPAWKNRRYAKGPWVSHVFRTHGSKTVSVLVIDPQTGTSHSASETLEVRDPDVFYSDANPWGFIGCQTYVINPEDDDTWTGEPTGAIRHNANAIWNRELPGRGVGPTRYLFKRGCQFNFGVTLRSGDKPHFYFGAYGTGAKPILQGPGSGENDSGNRVFDIWREYANSILPAAPDIRVVGLDVRGRYDPTTMLQQTPPVDLSSHFVYCDRSSVFVVSQCDVSGFRNAHFVQSSKVTGEDDNTASHQHFDDYFATDMGGQYPHRWAADTRENTSVSFTGCRIMHDPDSYSQGGEINDTRALIRHNQTKYLHMRGCDLFSTSYNNLAANLIETPESDGSVGNIHSSSIESPDITLFGLATNVIKSTGVLRRTTEMNVIVDGLILVGGYRTMSMIRMECTGVTIRNCLIIMPNTARYGEAFREAVSLEVGSATGQGVYVPAHVFAAPVKVYNNTFVYGRPGDLPDKIVVETPQGAYFVTEANNIWEGAWAGQAGAPSPFAPLSADVLWAPRCKGFKDRSFVLDDTYETPPDTVKAYAPQTGSAALGDAMEEFVSHMDINLKFRPAYPSKGAWEMP
jgi:hypothetical protein